MAAHILLFSTNNSNHYFLNRLTFSTFPWFGSILNVSTILKWIWIIYRINGKPSDQMRISNFLIFTMGSFIFSIFWFKNQHFYRVLQSFLLFLQNTFSKPSKRFINIMRRLLTQPLLFFSHMKYIDIHCPVLLLLSFAIYHLHSALMGGIAALVSSTALVARLTTSPTI